MCPHFIAPASIEILSEVIFSLRENASTTFKYSIFISFNSICLINLFKSKDFPFSKISFASFNFLEKKISFALSLFLRRLFLELKGTPS